VEAEFTEDEKRGRKNSPNLRRKFAGTQGVHDELRREMEGATSDFSQWGFLIWNQCVEENTDIYTGLGFGNISQFLDFRIILIPRIK
jgi:hypothetical protein